MAERVTKVTITAQVSGYLSGVEAARKKTLDMAEDSVEALEKQKAAYTELGTTALAFGAIAGAGVALAVKKFADFDAAMSSVQAATHESTVNMDLLREAAIDAGSETVFTAKESANAIEELAKAGVSTADILGGGLAGALDLASAGELEVADAAQIAATALTQFNLRGQDVPHVADLLAAGAGKAQGSVEDLSQALNQGGLVASQTGLNIEETTGTLAAFASAGLLGSDAGTSFKTMLQRLTPQSAEAREKMEELGISAYDAQGNFIGITKFAGVLQDALADLSPEARNAALSVIFGSDAVRAASVVYTQGARGIQDWIDKTNDTGFAAETARIKLDNLNGDVEKLGGSFDTLLIQSGSAANDSLRFLTQTATGLLDAFGALPPVFQGGVLVVGALVAGVGLLGGGFLTLVPKIAATREAMGTLNLTGRNLAGTLGKGGAVLVGVGLVVAGLSGLGQTAQLTSDQIAKLNAALKTSDLDNLSEQFDTGRRGVTGFRESLNQLYSGDFFQSEQGNLAFGKFMAGLGIDVFYKDLRETEAQFKQLGQTLADTATSDFPKANSQFQQLVKAAGGGEEAVRQLLEAFPEYRAALIDLASAQGQTLSDQDLLNLAMGKGQVFTSLMRDAAARNASALVDMGAAAEDTSGNIEDLVAKLSDFASTQFDADDAVAAFHQSLLDIQAAIGEEGFTGTLDEATQEGIDNNSMLREFAQNTNDAAAATLALTGNQEDANAILDEGRSQLEQLGGAFGLSGDALTAFIDKYIASPKDLAYEMQLKGLGDAQFALDQFLLGNMNRALYIDVRANMSDLNGAVSGTGRMGTFADGGEITGSGGPRSDNQLILASPGEHVLDARDVALMGGQAAVYAFRAALNSGRATMPRYADGGAVTPRYADRGGSAIATVNNTDVTVIPPPGPSPEAIGRAVADEINWKNRAGV